MTLIVILAAAALLVLTADWWVGQAIAGADASEDR